MKQGLVADILGLPVAERVRLGEAIWDSIAAAPDALPLTQWQREELDRRRAEFEADPSPLELSFLQFSTHRAIQPSGRGDNSQRLSRNTTQVTDLQ